MAYHLRALERWGLVCLRPGRAGTRPGDGGTDGVWCACGSSLEVRPGDSMAARTAQTALHHSLVDLLRTDLAGGVAQAPAEPAAVLGFTVAPLLLTDAEAAELTAAVRELLERFGHREAPPDARRYHVYWGPVPLPDRTATVRPLPGIDYSRGPTDPPGAVGGS
jgi:hypothetical protein